MTNNEFDKIVVRLSDAFSFNRFSESGVIQEYKRALMKYGFDQMNQAIDHLVESTDGKNSPAIGTLIKACKENPRPATQITNDTHCDVCEDRGFVLVTEKVEGLPYQFALYCPFCRVGQAQAYNGNNCKDNKCNAVCEPLTKYYDEQTVERIKARNRSKASLQPEEREKIRQMLAKVGLKMPAALDRGDAWEGEQCPF